MNRTILLVGTTPYSDDIVSIWGVISAYFKTELVLIHSPVNEEAYQLKLILLWQLGIMSTYFSTLQCIKTLSITL